MAERRERLGGEWFVERFVEGRELNVSVLAGEAGPAVLPLAEITFVGYPPDKPCIVGYAAKWDSASFECRNTVRRFPDECVEAALAAELRAIAGRCWEVFGLRGHARVDFRIDAAGVPWVLDVNANPCLAPDAGFAAALAAEGVSFETAIARIVADAWRRGAALSAVDARGEITLREDACAADAAGVVRSSQRPASSARPRSPLPASWSRSAWRKGRRAATVRLRRLPRGAGRLCLLRAGARNPFLVRPVLDRRRPGPAVARAGPSPGRARGGARLRSGRRAPVRRDLVTRAYVPTRAFYEACGFVQVAHLPDHYAPGDGKLILEKALRAH